MKDVELLFILFSAVSAAFGSCVVFTGILFPKMSKRPFMQIILLISICDVLACIASAFGFPRNRTPLCTIQAFTNVFFFKASWLWIVMLCHQMFFYLSKGRFGLSRLQMHAICWSVALLSTVLPLSQEQFGTDDSQVGWCFLTNSKTDSRLSLIWTLASFDLVLLLSICAMSFYAWRIYIKGQRLNNSKVSDIICSLYCYPLGMLFTWLPNFFMSTLIDLHLLTPIGPVSNAILILSTQNGTISAVIFFYFSVEARRRWLHVARKCCSCVSARQDSADEQIQVFHYDGNEIDVDESVFDRHKPFEKGQWSGLDAHPGDSSGSSSSPVDEPFSCGLSPSGDPIPVLSASQITRSPLYNDHIMHAVASAHSPPAHLCRSSASSQRVGSSISQYAFAQSSSNF